MDNRHPSRAGRAACRDRRWRWVWAGGLSALATVMAASGVFAQCGDGVWEPGEYCGQDAYAVTGTPDMNHDCTVDWLDLGLFFPMMGQVGVGLSADLNANGRVDSADLAILSAALGTTEPDCTPSGAGAGDMCLGSIALSFDSDPTNIVPTRVLGAPGPVSLYVVCDGWADARMMEYGVLVTGSVVLSASAVSGTALLGCGTGGLMVQNSAGFPGGPVVVARIDLFVLDLDPVTIELAPGRCAGGRVRWADSAYNRSIDFLSLSHAAINGTPPPGSATCTIFPDLAVSDLASPAELRAGCGTVEVTYTVGSILRVATGAFRTSVRVSPDTIITTDDVLAQTFDMGGLGPFEETEIVLPVSIPPSAPRGNVYIGAIADDLLEIVEVGEGNNAMSVAFSYQVPAITSIADIGNDQGRQVRVRVSRSPRDVAGSPTPVLQYEAFRRIDELAKPGTASGAGPSGAPEERLRSAQQQGMISDPRILLEGWDFVGAMPAHQEARYSMVAPTLADSTVEGGVRYSVFFMRAATGNPGDFFDSCPDSGYSLDNLAPNVPQNFQVAAVTGGDVQLSWDANGEPDLRYYSLFRGTDPGFVPGGSNRIARLTGTTFADVGGAVSPWYYKLSAADFAGNESGFARVQLDVTGVDPGANPPEVFGLRSGTANPARERAVVFCDLPVAAPVTLRVYDVRGRLVRPVLEEATLAAGRYRWEWDLRDGSGARVGPGVYFHRFEAGGFSGTVKTVVVR